MCGLEFNGLPTCTSEVQFLHEQVFIVAVFSGVHELRFCLRGNGRARRDTPGVSLVVFLHLHIIWNCTYSGNHSQTAQRGRDRRKADCLLQPVVDSSRGFCIHTERGRVVASCYSSSKVNVVHFSRTSVLLAR